MMAINTNNTVTAAPVDAVIRRGKDRHGHELADVSPCCQKSLVYFNEQVGQFVITRKYEHGHGDRRCAKCNRRVGGKDGE